MSRVAQGVVIGCALSVLAACSGDTGAGRESAAARSGLANATDGGIVLDVPLAKKLDLLFMIDNSSSMASKQARLFVQLPRMLSVLTSGDRCAALPADETCTVADAARYFAPIESLHVGVVTSNMGGIDNPPTLQASVVSCAGNGDDGLLKHDVDVALHGVTAVFNGEFGSGTRVGDVIIPPDLSCSPFAAPPLYESYTRGVDDIASTESELLCVGRVGVRGCPFEQQLEAPWKALAPSSGTGASYVFLDGTRGHGDEYNAGFLRDDALLGIVLLTDEDDCAITDAGKALITVPGQIVSPPELSYDEADAKYGALNLRCGRNMNDPELIQPVTRYIDGFKSLKPGHPERVLMLAITGVPPDAIAAGKSAADILTLPAMQFTEDLQMQGYPRASCTNSAATEVAYPPIRITQVAQGLGAQAVLASICDDSYRPGVASFVEKIASQLTP